MKKIYQLLIILLITPFFQNCNKFLDTPAPEISDETFFANDAAAITALAGAYDPMGWIEYSQYLEWAIGDVASDDAVKGGGGDSDQPQMYDIEHFQATPQTPTLSIVWKQLYVGINRANRVIAGVKENKNISEASQKRTIGEAQFLRGYYNFCLMKVFGAFPIVDHVLTPSEYNKPRNTIEECWAAIQNDFKDAMAALPKKSERPASELGRATWGAAAGYLAKAYIFEGKWKEAGDMAKQIVDSKEYSLEPKYGNLFLIETDNGVESVFDVQKKAFKTPLYGDEAEASIVEIYQRTRWDNYGWGFNQPTQSLYDEFEPGDIRRGWTIISDGDVLWEGTPDEETIYTRKDPVHNPDAVTGFNKRKGTIPKSLRGERDDQAGLNIRAIRFADVLLWQAEAAAHAGGDWETPLNKVRARAGLGASPFRSDPLKAVYHERRVELGMESHRYWDLVRTGRGNLMQGYTEKKRYLPIPQIEINLNPNLKQNDY